jgi:hypothetical protein
MSYTDGAPAAAADDWGEGWGAPKAPAKASPPPPAGPTPPGPTDDWGGGWKATPAPPAEDYGKAFGSGVTQGVVGPLEAPGGSASDLGAYLGSKVRPYVAPYVAGVVDPLKRAYEKLPSPADVAQQVTGGTVFDPSYQPKTFGGRVAQTAGALAPAAVLGPASVEGLATRAVTQAAVPALTTEVGRELGGRVGHPDIGAAVGGMATPFALNPAARSFIPTPAIEEAGATLGTRPLPPFAGSESPLAETTAKVLSKVPLANIPLRSAAAGAQKELGGAAAGVAERAGATTPEATGAAVEKAFNDYSSGVSDAANQKYGAVVSALPAGGATATGSLSATQQAVQDIAARRTASGAAAGPAVGEVQDALAMPGMTYQGMRDLRTRLRQEGNRSGLTPGERAEYGSLQDAVTNDINTHLNTLDPSGNATKLMADADQTYASDQGRVQAVGRRLGIDNASVSNEQYVNKIESMALGGKQDADLLAQTRQTLGPSIADQSAAQVAKKWWTGPDGQFAPQQFFKKYDSLTPEAKDALFGPQGKGGFRDSYDALSTLAKRDPTLQSVRPAAGGHGGVVGGLVAGAVGAGGEQAAAHFLTPETAIKAAAALPAPLVLSTLMARPEVAAAAARVGRASQSFDAARRLGVPDAQTNAAKILAAETGRFQDQAAAAGYDTGQQ